MKTSFTKWVYFLVFFIFSIQSYATHIIGGDLHVKWTGIGTVYQIRLNVYVNDKSIALHKLDTPIKQTVYFLSNLTTASSNRYIFEIDLPLVYNKAIATNSNFCATKEVVETNMQVYAIEIDLGQYLGSYSNSTFYITWENGFRNEIITNLVDPGNAAIALYVQCPRLSVQNSSPAFRPLQNEYFCKGLLSQYDMSATDINNDRLQYSLVSPLKSINPFEPTLSVDWEPGYGPLNPIPGTVPLTIDPNTGILTFNPSELGVFCFGIKVEEFRGNVKIGEVIKDYQFNVQACPVNNKPVIAFQDPTIKQSDTISVHLKEQKCFPIYITDVDASSLAISETIYVTSVTNAYPASAVTFPSEVNINGLKTISKGTICFDPCKALKLDQTTYYPMSFIIMDNRCPAKYDTLIFTLEVVVDPNAKPTIFIDPRTNPKIVKVDSLVQFGVFGRDSDVGDQLSLTIFNKRDGMVFRNVRDSTSTISSPFSWRPSCADLHPGIYSVFFLLKDNSCTTTDADTIQQTIVIADKEVSFKDLDVTNLVTPNGDGMNDYYRVPGIPEGNCSTYFRWIEIYNRWGARVFYSTDRAFKWYPEVSDGIYFYTLDFNSEQRRGWVEVIQ